MAPVALLQRRHQVLRYLVERQRPVIRLEVVLRHQVLRIQRGLMAL